MAKKAGRGTFKPGGKAPKPKTAKKTKTGGKGNAWRLHGRRQ